MLLPENSNFTRHIAREIRDCHVRPQVVLAPASFAQVQAAVRLLAKHRQSFAVLGGGHDVRCGSSSDQVVLSMRQMAALEVNEEERSLTFEGGVLSIDVLRALRDTGFSAVTGGCPTVGMTGFVLGGGYSDIASNLFGLGAANVLAARVVLASGRLVLATRHNQHRDLLWALMGGGGGKIGVVVQVKYKIHKIARFQFASGVIQIPESKRPLVPQLFADWSRLVRTQFPHHSGSHLLSMEDGSVQKYHFESMCVHCDWQALYAPLLHKYRNFFQSVNFTESSFYENYIRE